MQNYTDFFISNPNGVFCTMSGGAIKTRVFQYLWGSDGKAWFCTSNKKDVYAQLKENPAASFCVFDAGSFAVMSVSGKAVFVDDRAAKKRALDENPGIKNIYKTPENPDFEIFYLEVEEVDSFNFKTGKETLRLK